MLNQFSNDIASDFSKNNGNSQFDPAMVTAIIDIVVNLIERFKDCGKTADQALNTSHNPGLWERVILRNSVLRYLGRKQFREHGQNLIDSILKSGGKLNKDQMLELYSDVDKL
jgi:hypothetical protein